MQTAKLQKQFSIIPQFGYDPVKVLVTHLKGYRLHRIIALIGKEILRLHHTTRKQSNDSLRAVREVIRRLLRRLLSAEHPVFEGFLLSSHTGIHLKNAKHHICGNSLLPRQHKSLFVQKAAEFAIDLLKIQKAAHLICTEIKQKMSSVGHQPCTGQVYQPYIMGFPAHHQFQDQMMDRRILFVIFSVRDPLSGKQPDPVGGILPKQGTFFSPCKEMRIDPGDRIRKQLVNQIHSLLPPVDPAPVGPMSPPVRRLLAAFEQMGSPHRLPLELAKGVGRIRHRIAHGVRTDIQSEIVFSHLDNLPFLLYTNFRGRPL